MTIRIKRAEQKKQASIMRQHLHNLLRTSALGLIFISISHFSYALTAEANLDRFMLAAKKYLAEENYDRARYYLNRASKLEITQPPEYYFLLGQTLAVEGDITKARQAFETYVNKLGNKGPFYKASLENITELEEIELSREEVRKAFSADKQGKKPLISSTAPVSNKSYIEQLKTLYITDSDQDALTNHINTLLGKTPYSGEKIQNYSKPLILYKISVASQNQLLVTIKDNREKQSKISTERINVYGQDPFISYECRKTKGQCWVKQPDGFGKWMIIGPNEDNAAELARALTKLIKLLQASN